MNTLGEARRHFWLTVGMSRRIGVDLNEAIHAQRLTTTDYTDMVTRCRGCDWADACEDWQAAQKGAISECPRTCLNRSLWDHLGRVVA